MSKKTRPRSALLQTTLALAPIGLGLGLGFAPVATSRALAVEPAPTLTVVERTLAQDQGGWLINYRLRYQGTRDLVVPPAETTARLEAWVSNSRVASHAVPKLSTLVVPGATGLTGTAEVIAADDESQRCRERAVIQIWVDEPSGDHDATPPPPSSPASSAPRALVSAEAPRQPPLKLVPGATVRVRIKLEHLHFLFGDYDPLLGVRTLDLHLGAASIRDALPLDREQYLAQSRASWPAPPEDRRDARHFVSGPDSLHLEAHIPGNQYYRFPERPVRYATKMRLRYWYFIAAGTEGDCRARLAQYKDTPTSWKVLSDGAQEECLTKVGRWVKVERIFRTEPDATTLALDFRINSEAQVGEMWIDDVTLEPVCGTASPRP